MEFQKCNVKKHDLTQIADLIYETDTDLFGKLYGKNKTKALIKLKKLIKKESNYFGHKNIYVVEDNNKIVGLLIGYAGGEIDKNKEILIYITTFYPLFLFKIVIFEKLLIRRIVIIDPKPDDFYISNICVNENYRNKGVGTFLIEKACEIAKNKNCSKLILGVFFENKNAVNFYKEKGFETYNQKTIRFLSEKITILHMEYKF